MTLGRNRYDSSSTGAQRARRRKSQQIAAKRKVLLEKLEDRQLLAVGPQLIGIQPNNGELLMNGDTRNIAPRELLFRFDEGQAIDVATLDGIRITRLGDLFTSADDEIISPGFIGLGESSQQVVMRFASTLPDDNYRIEIFNFDNPAQNITALRNVNGDPFEPRVAGADRETLQFELDLGAQVIAVVPQPIERIGGVLTPNPRRIDVYFNNDDLNVASAQNPAFYQLILTRDTAHSTDDAVFNPTSVVYNAATDRATLTFANDLHVLAGGGGTFRLRIGTDEAALPAPSRITPGDAASTFAFATDVTGNLSANPSVIVSAAISPQSYPFEFPGALDEPGHRSIEHETHLLGGADASTFGSIPRLNYNFRDFYGFDPQGNVLQNLITDEQKQRAREVFQIYGEYLGIDFVETPASGMTIVTGDLRAVDPTVPTGPGGVAGIAGFGLAVMDAAENWDNRFGAGWFTTAMHEIGHLLGLGHNYELPPITIQGDEGALGPGSFPGAGLEPDYPGDHDIVHGQHLYRPDATDIDMYRFEVFDTGSFSAEILAERQLTASLLDSNLRLYRQNADGSRTLLAKNDDYFSEDSFLQADLTPGIYFVGVSAAGNEDYDPEIFNSGLGGVSQGPYDLRLTFRPDADNTIVDATGVALDGDADGIPGGVYNFWFRTQTPARTLIVDKSAPGGGTGSLAAPFNNIATAFAASMPGDIVRIVGNAGPDNNLATPGDSLAYEIGLGPLAGQILQDGRTMEVPRGVTVMIDAGAVFKLRRARIGVGSSTLGIDRSQGALQVLGTPERSVFFTSWFDESIGVDTNPLSTVPARGDWGGIVYRNDLDRDEERFDYERQGIFLNYVNHADMRYGGGTVVIDSVSQVINPIHMTEARPTVSFNTITRSADAAMSADPDSFEETNFHSPRAQAVAPFTSDYDRVGPEVHGNRVVNNSSNGLFVRIVTPAGNELKPLTVPGRFNDTDIVHIVSENLKVQGTPGGPIVEGVVPPSQLITLNPGSGGSLTVGGTYNYIITFVDSNGIETMASLPTRDVTLSGPTQRSILLRNLPQTSSPFVARRLYRSDAAGAGPYTLVAILNVSSTTYFDNGAAIGGTFAPPSEARRARTDARLAIDPGTVVKMEGARFEVTMGAQFIAEGTQELPIIFTSRLDDRFGAGGTFDTNNDGDQDAPARGDWGGIYVGHTSSASIDHSLVTFGGGVTRVEGSFAGFNALEIHQAEARVTNSIFEENANGLGGQAPSHRFGRNSNSPGAIFVRTAQPVIVDNVIRHNGGAAININANALSHVLVVDLGRETGPANQIPEFQDNQGPLVRLNLLDNNSTNGMQVRSEVLTTETVWDDTDIVHVVTGQIVVPDFHTFGGLRLESGFDESLVVKLSGANAGFTATGRPLDIDDRIGGSIQIVGQPGRPVFLTSIHDDTVGAGFRPDGQPLVDTNNNGNATTPQPGDWRSVRFDAFSHDRNVETILELEPGEGTETERNASPETAQFLGELARAEKRGDENLRLGFEIHGSINQPADLDVYSFVAFAGTEVWFDFDRTTYSLDTVIELIDANGNIIAQSDNSPAEQNGTLPLFSDPAVTSVEINPLLKTGFQRLDHYTVNPRDAGMRLVLPGNFGTPTTYHVRVRSSNLDETEPQSDLQDPAKVLQGRSTGVYQLQIRLSELDEVPGSTVRYSDIRYATNGVELFGMPQHSPLLGEAAETSNNNDSAGGGQDLGALGSSDREAISVAGNLISAGDIDFYRFSINVDSIQSISGFSNPSTHVPVVIDLDYSDGMGRSDNTISIFDSTGRLILRGTDSNIADDRPGPLEGADIDDLSRGSPGALDAFIGPVELPVGDYFLAVHNVARTPQVLDQFLTRNPANPLLRLEPITSTQRIAEDRISGSGGSNVVGASSLPVLFDGTSVVPFHLGDVNLFVSRGQGFTGNNRSSVYSVDPFTGGFETILGQYGPGNGDIAMRADGELFSFSTLPPIGTGVNDGNVGNYLLIDTGTAAVTNFGDDGVATLRDDPNNAGLNVQNHNVGIAYNAIAFRGTNRFDGYVVGERNAGSAANRQPFTTNPYDDNILYNFDINNGQTVRNPFGPNLRTGNGRIVLAGTEAVEMGRLLTATELTVSNAEVGDTFTINISGNLLPVTITGGAPGTPVADSIAISQIASAINSSGNPAFQNFNAYSRDDFFAGGNFGDVDNILVIALVDPAGAFATISSSASNVAGGMDTQSISGSGFGPGGDITGMTFVGGQAYAVTDTGGLFTVNTAGTFTSQTRASYVRSSAADLLTGLSGNAIDFQGLAVGPDEVEEGAFARTLFGVSTGGRMFAFDTSGALQTIFVDNQTSVQLLNENGSPLSNVTGLDFGTLDRNLWHITGNRGSDPGHGITETWENSRLNVRGGSSFYFGNERSGSTAGNKNNLGSPALIRDVNFPGGAHGSIVSHEFDLSGFAPEDQPMLYFNYFLETEEANHDPGPSPPILMRDAFRVFVAADDGNWTLVGTNDSFQSRPRADEFDIGPRDTICTTPVGTTTECVQELFENTGGWRQARIPLAAYAGESHVRLRFDFSTAGAMDTGVALTGGDELRTIRGEQLRDGQTFTIDGNQVFEFDLGYTLVTPSGGAIADGQTFTVGGTTYEFDLPAAPGVSGGNTPVSITPGMTASQVAQVIEVLLGGGIFPPSLTGALTNESNDTLSTAEISGLPGGEASYFATGTIGDNTVNPLITNQANEVDLVQITVGGPSEILSIDIDADLFASGLDPMLTLFDSLGNIVAQNDTGAAPTEPNTSDAFISITGLAAGTYYVGVSASANGGYNPTVAGSGAGGLTTGAYELFIDVTLPALGLGVHRVDNRINLPDVPSGQLTLPGGSPLFLEGEPGLIDAGAEQMIVHAGMTREEVAPVVQQALANVFAGGNPSIVKQYKDLVRVIGHQVSDPGPLGFEERLAGDSFGAFHASGPPTINGRYAGSLRGMNNAVEGVYIDDVIIGLAERGEMVVNAIANSSFISNPELLDPNLQEDHQSILVGPYDVEIRRGADYGLSNDGNPTLLLYDSFNTNQRIARHVSFTAPSAADIVDGQTFTLSDGVDTLTFEFRDMNVSRSVAPGNVEVLFEPLAGSLAAGIFNRTREANFEVARTIRDAINSPQARNVLDITAGIADGTNSGVGTPSGGTVTGSTNAIINLYGGTVVGDHTNLTDFFDFGSISSFVTARDVFLQFEHNFVGDDNHFRDQGQVQIHSNTITRSAQFGIVSDAAQRGSPLSADAGPLPHMGAVRNAQELNNNRLAPSVVIENNIVAFSQGGGIRISGEPANASLGLSATPFHRVVNNTIFGGATPRGVGIQVNENSSPTLLNNILAGLATGISVDSTSSSTVIGGSVYQNNTNNTTGAGLGDFPIALGPNDPLFVNAAAGNFYLEFGSLAIDSSVASLEDRPELQEVKSPLGLRLSPILAPDRDVTGQLRVDDPNVPTPVGLGSNVFVDRGALDRSDFTGPNAIITNPRDNDTDGLDLDGGVSVVRRADGTFANFSIQLFDGNDPSDPLDGVGIDSLSVRPETVTVFRNDVFLKQGVDYNFSYNATSQIIRLTPLSGVWAPGAYVISLANDLEFKVPIGAGDTITDGDMFNVIDRHGNNVTFEFESGFSLFVPETLTIQTPGAGGGPGGVDDGDTFTIDDGAQVVLFEFNSDGKLNNMMAEEIVFSQLPSPSTQLQLADAIADALNGAPALGLVAKTLTNGNVHVGAPIPIVLDVSGSPALAQSGQAGVVLPGQSFHIQNGPALIQFTLGGNVPFGLSNTYEELAANIAARVNSANIGLTATNFGDGHVHLGGGPQHLLDTSQGGLTHSGAPGVTDSLALNLPGAPGFLQVPAGGGSLSGIDDGEFFTINDGAQIVAFEFDNNGVVSSPNVPIPFTFGTTQNDLADAIVNEVINAMLANVSPANLGNGVVTLGAGPGVTLDLTGSPNLLRPYRPGGIADGETFTISDGTTTRTFEFDRLGDTVFGNVVIPFALVNTADEIANAIVAAVNGAGIGLSAMNQGNGVVTLGETAAYTVDVSLTSLSLTGVPGGAVPVPFLPDASFTSLQVAGQIVGAIDGSPLVEVTTRLEGDRVAIRGGTAVTGFTSQQVNPITDLAQNRLSANQADGDTRFTVLLGTFELDFGDAPDPTFPTLAANNGARHVLVPSNQLFLGASIDAELDGQPTANADGDDNDGNDDDDGVVFVDPDFSPFIDTRITVFSSGIGLLGAWIDLNQDGDWNDPGEKVLSNEPVVAGPNNLTIRVPQGTATGFTYARFRISSSGSLTPSGIVINGEVEDYRVHVAPGTPPVANNDGPAFVGDPNFTTTEDAVLSPLFNLLGNDTDVDVPPDPPLTAVPVVGGLTANGASYSVNANGTFSYDPTGSAILQALPDGASFTDTFTYSVHDGTFQSVTPATVTIVVNGVNDDPVGVDDPFSTDEDTIVSVTNPQSGLLDNDIDVDAGAILTATPFNGVIASGATVVINSDGTFTYNPTTSAAVQALNPGGMFTDTFTYTVVDEFGGTDTATATITISGLNDAPVAINETFNTNEDTVLSNSVLFSGDFDPDAGDVLQTIPSVGPSAFGASVTILADGSFTYDPTGSATLQALPATGSQTDTFTYRIEDSVGARTTGTVTVNVQGLNDAPRAVNDGNYATDEDTRLVVANPSLGVLFNDRDPDMDPFSIVSFNATTARGATVVLNADGTFTYDPRSSASLQSLPLGSPPAVDTFTYTLSDGIDLSAPATVTVLVAGRNDRPVAANGTFNIDEDGGPLANAPFPVSDVDTDQNPPLLSIVITVPPSKGLVTNNIDGTFTFDPGMDFDSLGPGESETVTMTYVATDRHGLTSAPGTISFVVGGENDPPTAINDIAGAAAGSAATISVLLNDFDVDGLLVPSTVAISSGPSSGNAVANADGTITYTPNAGFSGTDSFTYTVEDDDGAVSNVATVTVFISQSPVANDDSATGLRNQQNVINVLANDIDPDGSLDPSTVSIVSSPSSGTVSVNPNGTVTYTPNLGFVGTDTFTYTVDDNAGLTSNIATVTVTTVLNPTPFTNPDNNLDVNADGFVAPDDALIIINFLNLVGGIMLPNPPTPGLEPPPFLDPTGDGFVSPDDVLIIINFLNMLSPPPAEGEGEGEGGLLLAAESTTQDLVGLFDFTAPQAVAARALAAEEDVLDDALLAGRRDDAVQQRLPQADLLVDDILPSLSARRRSFQELDLDDLLSDIVDDLAENRDEQSAQDLAVRSLWT